MHGCRRGRWRRMRERGGRRMVRSVPDAATVAPLQQRWRLPWHGMTFIPWLEFLELLHTQLQHQQRRHGRLPSFHRLRFLQTPTCISLSRSHTAFHIPAWVSPGYYSGTRGVFGIRSPTYSRLYKLLRIMWLLQWYQRSIWWTVEMDQGRSTAPIFLASPWFWGWLVTRGLKSSYPSPKLLRNKSILVFFWYWRLNMGVFTF